MYNNFAKYYDALMCDVDYSARVDYLRSLFERYGKIPTLLLDLACGTGNISNEFAKKGVSVIGVDISEEMLSLAQEKSRGQNLDVMYLCQSAAELDLYGTVDGAVCCLDSLNHITDYGKFCEVFVKVSLFLEKDALFIFDMNTVYKHEKILAENAFVFEDGDVYCVWQNTYSKEKRITDISLDFFENTGSGYMRSTEMFCERAYSEEQIKNAIINAGLSLEAVFGDMSYKAPKQDEQRTVFVARKV